MGSYSTTQNADEQYAVKRFWQPTCRRVTSDYNALAAGFIAVAWSGRAGFAGVRTEFLLTEAAVFALWLLGLLLAFAGSRGAAQELATVRTLILAAEETSSARSSASAAATRSCSSS